jgi:hypothetical protein
MAARLWGVTRDGLVRLRWPLVGLSAILIVVIIPRWLLQWDLGAQVRALNAADKARAINDIRSSAIQAVPATVVVVGVIIAFRQLRTAVRSFKAQVLIRLAEDWRSPEIYRAVIYINDLRGEWKRTSAPRHWPDLAAQWVSEHAGKRPQAGDQENQLWNEWLMRRTAAQFVAKMGALMRQGYISADDLFRVIPEMGRLLAVLIPIELAILEYWSPAEGASIAEWDRPVGKWEFRELWREYQEWYRTGGNKVDLDWTDWRGVLDSIDRWDELRS